MTTWILVLIVVTCGGSIQLKPLRFSEQRDCVTTALEIKRDFAPTKVRWSCIKEGESNGDTDQ